MIGLFLLMIDDACSLTFDIRLSQSVENASRISFCIDTVKGPCVKCEG